MREPLTLGALRVRKTDASVVAALIEAQIRDQKGPATSPFASLSTLARKLLAAARRKRRSDDRLTLRNILRVEAHAGFLYLTLFSHPSVPDGFLDHDQATAVQAVAGALAAALSMRRGVPKLTRREIDDRLKAVEAVAVSDCAAEPLDDRWIRRLKSRVARQDALNSTVPHSLDASLLEWLALTKKAQ